MSSTDRVNSYSADQVGDVVRRSKSKTQEIYGTKQKNAYFHDYNDQPAEEEKDQLSSGPRIAITPTKAKKNQPYFHEYGDQGKPVDDVRKVARKNRQKEAKVVSNKKDDSFFDDYSDNGSPSRREVRTAVRPIRHQGGSQAVRNDTFFDDYSDQGIPAEEEKQDRTAGSQYIAGVSTGAKVNHPYNFSYGDQNMPEGERRAPIDNGFIAGMSTGAKVNHPYNFSYGDQNMPEEDKDVRYDNGFIAGVSSVGNRLNHPYNFAYGGDQNMPEEEKDVRYDTGVAAGISTGTFTKQTSPYFYVWDPSLSTWIKPGSQRLPVDPNYVAGMATAARTSHPYNYAWGKSFFRQSLNCVYMISSI